MDKFKIIHDHEGCIGCGACVAVAEKYWEMVGDKAHLKKSEMVDGNEVRVCDKDYDLNEEAAQVCPVSVIHLKKIGREEKDKSDKIED